MVHDGLSNYEGKKSVADGRREENNEDMST